MWRVQMEQSSVCTVGRFTRCLKSQLRADWIEKTDFALRNAYASAIKIQNLASSFDNRFIILKQNENGAE